MRVHILKLTLGKIYQIFANLKSCKYSPLTFRLSPPPRYKNLATALSKGQFIVDATLDATRMLKLQNIIVLTFCSVPLFSLLRVHSPQAFH